MRGLWLAAVLALAVPAGARQMTADALRDFGAKALMKGYAAQAYAVGEVLLARDAGDSAALVLQAQALRLQGRLPESEAKARAAWAVAQSPAARFTAATALAQAISLQGHRMTAQYWLRQAVQNAPTAQAAAQAVQDLRYVRGETPVTLRFDLSLQPSDNVNGGARVDSFQLGGVTFPLPAQLTAQSGLAWSLGVSGDWRLASNAVSETALTFEATRSGAFLSSQARDAGGEDQALDFLHLGFGLDRKGRGGSDLAVDIGQNSYGGEKLSATFGVSGQWQHDLGPGRADFGLGVTREARIDRAEASSTQGRLVAGWSVDGPRGDRWRIGLHVTEATSQDDTVARHEAGLSLDWQGDHPVLGLGFSAHLAMTGADYGSGRQEGRLAASVEAEIARASWLGFAPVLSLDWGRANSNLLIYDTESLGIGLTIRSRF